MPVVERKNKGFEEGGTTPNIKLTETVHIRMMAEQNIAVAKHSLLVADFVTTGDNKYPTAN